MITHYGYSDGSGDYYIVIDTDKCTGCGKCVKACPQSALELVTMMIDLDDKTVVAVTEQQRKNIKYTCSSCRPETGKAPCVLACMENAIKCVWNPR
ncbi:4Fe-4S dicluster domain-containing protein [Candidatus Bathyarchaeota archaeon A05DMB-2]|nr:4Fe-4S dicluster domain-containing protein [Candidatus Bathyarchaeota archaeon A05DMB-2]